MIKGAVTAKPATEETSLQHDLISGVGVPELKNLITTNGMTTEVFRPEWNLLRENLDHIIHVVLRPNAISAWHMHELRTDLIFVTEGVVRIVLYDDRRDSPTYKKMNVINAARMRPTAVTIPNGVWHGLQNLEQSCSSFLNCSNHAYNYEDPDEWRLPSNTTEIPYKF